MTQFLCDNALKCFAEQIVLYMYEPDQLQSSSLFDSEYVLYCQTLSNGANIGSDMDILLGFTCASSQPIEYTIRISNVDVATKKVQKGEFVSVLDMGQCIPLTSLENYRVSLHITPETESITCLIGRLKNIRKRVQIKDCIWKYISFERKFFLVKCANLHIQHITHIRDFEDIPYLPNIQLHVDYSIEQWKKQKCQQMVDVILQDLMEKTWHPSRHIDWCLDHEEKEGLV